MAPNSKPQPNNQGIILESYNESIKSHQRRYEKLSENFTSVEKELINRDDNWISEIKKIGEELDLLKSQLNSLRDSSSKDITSMEQVIVKFKGAAKMDEYNLIMKDLNSWFVENMITKERFKLLLAQEIEKRI